MSLPEPDQIEIEADGSEDEIHTGWKHWRETDAGTSQERNLSYF